MMANPSPSPSTPVSSVPLNLAGFLAGSTIRVEGDAGNFHFSGQFDIHQCHTPNNQTVVMDNPDYETQCNQSFSISSFFPSMAAPETTLKERDQTTDRSPSTHLEKTLEFSEFCHVEGPKLVLTVHDDQIIPASETRDIRDGNGMRTVTRLRSGVISRVSYFRFGRHGFVGEKSEDGRRQDSCLLIRKPKERREIRKRSEEVLKRMLRRHSFPVRPCSSYSFFVMSNWDLAKSSSFEETSKRLSQMWSNLPHKKKKVFVEMASKDNARYKKQCSLLTRKTRGSRT